MAFNNNGKRSSSKARSSSAKTQVGDKDLLKIAGTFIVITFNALVIIFKAIRRSAQGRATSIPGRIFGFIIRDMFH